MRVDSAIVEAVRWSLRPGKGYARSGKEIVRELALYGFKAHARRIGEAVAELIEQGFPVCSTAADGYWLATTAEEIEASLLETEKRARMMLRRRRLLRRSLLRFRGQLGIGEAA